jgi:hypothetical protein
LKLIHTYSSYTPRDADTARRNALAAKSWQRIKWVDKPIRDEVLPRMWAEGDRKLPFIKDIFAIGCQGADPQDIVVYTNSDIVVRSDVAKVITDKLTDVGACYAFRRDFIRLGNIPPDSQFVKGAWYAGSDLYAMRVWFYDSVFRAEMPDMLCGMEAWDPCARTIIEESNAGKDVEIRDVIAHERHGGDNHWENPKNRYKLKGQFHNLGLAVKFFDKRGMDPRQFGIPNDIVFLAKQNALPK